MIIIAINGRKEKQKDLNQRLDRHCTHRYLCSKSINYHSKRVENSIEVQEK